MRRTRELEINMMHRVIRQAALGALFCAMAACGGGESQDDKDEPLNTDYSQLRVPGSSEAPLVRAVNDEQLLGLLKNGARLSGGLGGVTFVSVAPPAPTTPGFSATTIQIDGVDEADVTKYDGQYIYTLQSEPGTGPGNGHSVRVIRTDRSTATMEALGEFPLEGVSTDVGYTLPGRPGQRPMLYVVSGENGATQSVAVINQRSLGATAPNIVDVIPPQATTIRLVDVADPAHLRQAWKIELDGAPQATRKIGSTLYVVTLHSPVVPGLTFPADSEATKQANERLIRQAGARALLPAYRENDSESRTLVQPADCLVAQTVNANDAYPSLVTLTAIDLTARRITGVSCLSTNVNAVYVSKQSLYVGGDGERASDHARMTIVHKFALADGAIRYVATGGVIGQIGWSNPSYFMDEHEGDLRIVTTESGSVHRLSVLRESDRNRMVAIATLPNDQRPAPIGKPNEQLYAVRFLGGRAYAVTFQVTDPLYALDLSDPTDPRIAGQLEIPGFSNICSRSVRRPLNCCCRSVRSRTTAA